MVRSEGDFKRKLVGFAWYRSGLAKANPGAAEAQKN